MKKLMPGDAEAVIAETHYWMPEGLRLTVCCLVLKNGFTVTGTASCVREEDYDATIGMQVARRKAVDEIFPLLGYMMRENENG